MSCTFLLELVGDPRRLDGTIVDTEAAAARSWQEEYKRAGLSLSLARFAGYWISSCWLPAPGMIDRLKAAAPGIDRDTVTVRQAARWAALSAELPALPGIAGWIQAARDTGLKVAIATNDTYRRVPGHLARLGLDQYVDAVVSAGDGYPLKPDPGVYRAALERLSVPPGSAVAVEDSPAGVAAAAAAGIRPVLVPGTLTRLLPRYGVSRSLTLGKAEAAASGQAAGQRPEVLDGPVVVDSPATVSLHRIIRAVFSRHPPRPVPFPGDAGQAASVLGTGSPDEAPQWFTGRALHEPGRQKTQHEPVVRQAAAALITLAFCRAGAAMHACDPGDIPVQLALDILGTDSTTRDAAQATLPLQSPAAAPAPLPCDAAELRRLLGSDPASWNETRAEALRILAETAAQAENSAGEEILALRDLGKRVHDRASSRWQA